MAELKITDRDLVIDIKGLDQLLALRSSLSIPLSSIQAVTPRPVDAKGQGNIKAYRVAGANVGNILAGYFWASEGLGASPGPVLQKLEEAREAVEAWPDDAAPAPQSACARPRRSCGAPPSVRVMPRPIEAAAARSSW